MPSFRACLRIFRLSSAITMPMNFGAPSCFANPRAGDADRLSAALEDREGLLEVFAAERVQHDVVAGEDLGEVLLPVVHDDVGAEAAQQLRVLAAGGRRHRGADVLGELDYGRSQPAGAGVDEDLLAGLHVGTVDEGLPGGQ